MTDQNTNPLLQKLSMPGETFRLPSGGMFYEESVLDPSVKNGEVHVYPMAAYDEILLKTPDKLFSGDAVREVFGRCIPQILKPGRLFAKDVDYLLICLRKVSYGEQLPITYTHNCEGAQEHNYTVDVNQLITQTKVLDPTTSISDYQITLENGQVVKMQPLRFDDYVAMMQTQEENSQDLQQLQRMMIDAMLYIIRSVDDYQDSDTIREWLEHIPPKYMKEINNHINNTVEWGPDFRVDLECKDCGQQMEVTTPLNPLAFFT